MNEDELERLSRTAMNSLREPAPADLKADLKRLARARRPSALESLREYWSAGPWAYGAGAAFAAAAIAVVVLSQGPTMPSAPRGAPDAAPRDAETQTPSARALRDLWSDDDGGDDDEI